MVTFTFVFVFFPLLLLQASPEFYLPFFSPSRSFLFHPLQIKIQTTDIPGSIGIPRSTGFNLYRKALVPRCKSGIILILFNVINSSDPKSVSPTISLFPSVFSLTYNHYLYHLLYILHLISSLLYYIFYHSFHIKITLFHIILTDIIS